MIEIKVTASSRMGVIGAWALWAASGLSGAVAQTPPGAARDWVAGGEARANPAPSSGWLVGTWEGVRVVCGRLRRDDGEVVSVLGVLPSSRHSGQAMRLQGHYVSQSPCQETRETFVVLAQP